MVGFILTALAYDRYLFTIFFARRVFFQTHYSKYQEVTRVKDAGERHRRASSLNYNKDVTFRNDKLQYIVYLIKQNYIPELT